MTKKHQIRHVVSAVYSTPWAITRAKLDEIVDLIDRRSEGHLTEAQIEARLKEIKTPSSRYRDDEDNEDDRPYSVVNGVAIISLYGVLGPRMNLVMSFSGGTSTQEFQRAVDMAIDDDEVRAIVLDVDSPGGNVLGTPEAAERVALAAAKKTVVAVATGMMCSAAYYIGSAAPTVVASKSSLVGSIGVYSVHADYSAAETLSGVKRTVIHAGTNKVMGNSHETLNQAGRESMKGEVDDYYDMFVAAIADHRGVSIDVVETQFGQGDAMVAYKAKERGLIDRVGTLSEIVAELGQDANPKSAGQSTSSITLQKENSMDKLMQALIARNLISGSDNKQAAFAAIRGWYAARSEDVPTGDDKEIDCEQVVKDFEAADKPETPNGEQGDTKPNPAAGEQQSSSTPPQTPAPKPESQADQTPEQIAAAERYRIGEIQAIAEQFRLDASVAEAAVDGGTSVESFIKEARTKMGDRDKPVGRIEPGEASADKFQSAAVEALARRGGIELEGNQSQGAEQLQYMSLLDMGRESLRVAGCRSVTGLPDSLAKALLGDREALREIGAADRPMHGPGSFPNILSGLASQVLETAPRYADTTFQHWAHKRPSVPDRRPQTLIRFGEFGELPEHVDGDDFEQSTVEEDYSWIQAAEYGDKFGLTPMMIEHDDLGAFMDAMSDKQNAHDATLNRLCLDLLTGNVACADTVALFHTASHGNDIAAGGGAAPSAAQLSAMRLLLRRQTGIGGLRKINQTVHGLLIPEDLETVTEQLLETNVRVLPTTTATGEIWRGRVKWWVEPMLATYSAAVWYAFADPARARSIVYAYQRGYENMRTENYYDPSNECRWWKYKGRFAAGINNYRGVVRNAGA